MITCLDLITLWVSFAGTKSLYNNVQFLTLIRALKPPGFRREWHLGVRVSTNKKLVGFITAIPAELKVEDK
jgi:hypothetical protein